MVADLIDAQCREWRQPLLNVLFPSKIVGVIHSIYVPAQEVEDKLVWEYTKNGKFFQLSLRIYLVLSPSLGESF